MTDEKKNISPDDEYQFPQDEYASSGAVKTDAETPVDHDIKKSFVEQLFDRVRHVKIKNKRIVYAVIAVVVIVIIFHFVNHSAPVTPTPVVQTTEVQPTNENLGTLDSLRAHSSRAESQIRDLRSQLSDIQDSLNQTETNNQQLQKSVAELTAQVQLMSEQLDKLMTKAPVAKTGKRIIFHLRAVLPDRAWITSSTGQTISVTVGDDVKQYGTVQSIDSQRGIVTTSSGRKIEYGPNDY